MIDDDKSEDNGGYYTHPEFQAFIGDNEWIPKEDIDAWGESKGIELFWEISDWEDEEQDLGGDFDFWKPEKAGWKTLMRYDTEDSELVVIWYREKS